MIYLDNSATSHPKPAKVYSAVSAALRESANPGRGGYMSSQKASEKVLKARECLAQLFKITNPERIIFTPNATTALNIAIKGSLNKGDGLLISSMEHNSVLRPAKVLEREGVTLRIASSNSEGIVSPEVINALLDDKIKLLCITHASNVSGSINDISAIGKIARKKGVLFLVDASQSAGVIDIDIEESCIDLLAFPGHKSLFGPQGTGGLYIREGINLKTLIEGGTGSESANLSQPDFLPDRFESGTLNTPGIAGLSEGVSFILENGIKAVSQKETECVKMLIEDLAAINGVEVIGPKDYKKRAGAVSIVTKMDCALLAQLLDKYDICVRAGLHCAPIAHKSLKTFESGTVRFSPGFFTTKKEIKQAVFDLNKILSGKA